MPRIWPNVSAPDLLVSGPNVGQNLGPFLYTISGTMGATYAAVSRGIPAIAFSASSIGGQRSYEWINATTASGYPDPATIHAELTVKLVQQLVDATPKGERLLPLGYGIKYVNYRLVPIGTLPPGSSTSIQVKGVSRVGISGHCRRPCADMSRVASISPRSHPLPMTPAWIRPTS